MGEIAHGVDNLQSDGSFYCDGHSGGWFGSDRMGGAKWVTGRWKRGTKPANYYRNFECERGHQNKVSIPKDEWNKSGWGDYDTRPTMKCGTCGETATFTFKGMEGENCDSWPYDTIIPRTCSFCGSIHPEDLIELTKRGFTPDASTKSYKYYVNGPDGRSLLPPIKFYTNHVNADLIKRLNEALDEYQGRAS